MKLKYPILRHNIEGAFEKIYIKGVKLLTKKSKQNQKLEKKLLILVRFCKIKSYKEPTYSCKILLMLTVTITCVELEIVCDDFSFIALYNHQSDSAS